MILEKGVASEKYNCHLQTVMKMRIQWQHSIPGDARMFVQLNKYTYYKQGESQVEREWKSWKQHIHFPLLLGIVLWHEKHRPQHIFPQTERQKLRRSLHLPHQPQLLPVKSSPHQGGHREVYHLIKKWTLPKISHAESTLGKIHGTKNIPIDN